MSLLQISWLCYLYWVPWAAAHLLVFHDLVCKMMSYAVLRGFTLVSGGDIPVQLNAVLYVNFLWY